MATPKTFIPMVSASPPPLDGFDDDEEDDFGSFASAGFSPEKSKPLPQNDNYFFPIKEQQQAEDQDEAFGSFETSESSNNKSVTHEQAEDIHNNGNEDSEPGTFPHLKAQSMISDDTSDMKNNLTFTSFHGFTNGAAPSPRENDNTWTDLRKTRHLKSDVITDSVDELENQTAVSNHVESKCPEDFAFQESKDDRETSDSQSRNSMVTNSSNSYSDDNAMDCQSPCTSDSHSQDTDSSDFQSSRSAKGSNFQAKGNIPEFMDGPRTMCMDMKSSHEIPSKTNAEASSKHSVEDSRNITSLHMNTDENVSEDDEFGNFSSSSLQHKENPPMSSSWTLGTSDARGTAKVDLQEEGLNQSVKDSPREPPSDDWGDFDSVPVSTNKPTQKKSEIHSATLAGGNNDGDDFDNFQSFKEESSIHFEEPGIRSSQSKPGESHGGFGAFQESSSSAKDIQPIFSNSSRPMQRTPSPAPKLEEDDFDDFGDFGTFHGGSSSQSTQGSSSAGGDFQAFGLKQPEKKSDFGFFSTSPESPLVSSSQASGSPVDRVFKSCFPGNGPTPAASLVVDLLIDIIVKGRPEKGDDTPKEVPRKTGASRQGENGSVWNCLRDLERTNALGYQWVKSGNSQHLLGSLGVDSRNILAPKKAGMPIFAPDLGMLTPSKPGEKQQEKPSAVGGSPREETPDGNQGSTPAGTPEDAVPKVEFDWTSSGLTNPLDAPPLDPEILKLEKSGPPQPLPLQKTNKPLDDILKSSASSMVKQRSQRDAGLSSEANRVLDGLPSLSFMHAKVLMFPMRPLEGGTTTGGSATHGSLL